MISTTRWKVPLVTAVRLLVWQSTMTWWVSWVSRNSCMHSVFMYMSATEITGLWSVLKKWMWYIFSQTVTTVVISVDQVYPLLVLLELVLLRIHDACTWNYNSSAAKISCLLDTLIGQWSLSHCVRILSLIMLLTYVSTWWSILLRIGLKDWCLYHKYTVMCLIFTWILRIFFFIKCVTRHTLVATERHISPLSTCVMCDIRFRWSRRLITRNL